MTLTSDAFNRLRATIGEARPPARPDQDSQQSVQMSIADGLVLWGDGQKGASKRTTPTPPVLTTNFIGTKQSLWVVRADDVAHAPEHCQFGQALMSKVIKHTNLTGGRPAFAGGELLWLKDDTIAINGCSGRYGPRCEQEMNAVARAFSESGYDVWSMGWDEDANKPAPFIGYSPQWVA